MTRKRQRLLQLCARPTLTAVATAALDAHLKDFSDWENLPEDAERERMVPLVCQHLATLGVTPPIATRRQLAAQLARQRALSERQQRALRRAVSVCRDNGIEVIRLKGAGLVSGVYARAALRPMDDIDLLLPPEHVASARDDLIAHGFIGSPADGKDERPHHAAPVFWREDGFCTAIELHRYMPAGGIAQSWEQLRPYAIACDDIPGTFTPHPRHFLWQVYHHAFRSSLRWTPLRLIWVADLVGLLTELLARVPDVRPDGLVTASLTASPATSFDDATASCVTPPPALRGLAALHHLTPLPDDVLHLLGGPPAARRNAGDTYCGWPYRKLGPRTLWRALTPPDWWLHMRHGVGGEDRRHCLREHFRDLWRERQEPWRGIACG